MYHCHLLTVTRSHSIVFFLDSSADIIGNAANSVDTGTDCTNDYVEIGNELTAVYYDYFSLGKYCFSWRHQHVSTGI